MIAAQVERFWSSVDKSGDCWEWTGHKDKKGYGSFRFMLDGKKSRAKAHRYAYELEVGPIPKGLEIDHRCHNHSCVNPAHLRPVTTKQNQENRVGAQSNSKSGIRGVSWHAATKKWRAVVGHNGKYYQAGAYDEIAEAGAAVVALRRQLFTHNDRDRTAA
jgi:hypothetical protein